MTLEDLVSRPQNHNISTSMIQRYHHSLLSPNQHYEHAHSYALKNLKLLFLRSACSKWEMAPEGLKDAWFSLPKSELFDWQIKVFRKVLGFYLFSLIIVIWVIDFRLWKVHHSQWLQYLTWPSSITLSTRAVVYPWSQHTRSEWLLDSLVLNPSRSLPPQGL